MKILLYIVALIAFFTIAYLAYERVTAPSIEEVTCSSDTMQCPDGSTVSRVAPLCSFAPCPELTSTIPDDVQAHIDSKAELITLANPEPYGVIESPLTITGEARGTWYFEASFPVVLVDWDGKIIAEGVAQANGDWMTEEFVPFTATLTFEKPETDNRGSLILKKDNPSGLPENDDALEIPIRFSDADAPEVQ